jgi:hypothetical protein
VSARTIIELSCEAETPGGCSATLQVPIDHDVESSVGAARLTASALHGWGLSERGSSMNRRIVDLCRYHTNVANRPPS